MKKFDQRCDWGVEHSVPRRNKKNEKKISLGIRPAPYAAPAYPLPRLAFVTNTGIWSPGIGVSSLDKIFTIYIIL